MPVSRHTTLTALTSSLAVAALFVLTGTRAPASGVTPEQLEILHHLTLVKLPDGAGGNQPTLRITGLNVQIVNGEGMTESENARGNLILGYDERAPDEVQTGSHNLVLGTRNQHSSHGGIVAGSVNSILAPYATATGGRLNRLAGPSSSVSGGVGNRTTGYYTSILGGTNSTAAGNLSTVYGGVGCWTGEQYSVVAGCSQTTTAECQVLP